MCLAEGALQAYVDDEMKDSERASALAHLADCPRCREAAVAAAARAKRVTGLLQIEPRAGPSETTAVALARLRERLTAGCEPEFWTSGIRRFRSVAGEGRGVLAVATLAALALLAAVLGWRGIVAPRTVGSGLSRIESRGTEPRRIERTRVGPGPLESTPVPHSGQPPSSFEGSPREMKIVTRPVRLPAANRPPSVALASDNPYYLLTADATPPELGVVVRVRVPLSMLTGDPGSLSGAGDPGVEADVLVGQDGRPRAIRFVNQMQPVGGK